MNEFKQAHIDIEDNPYHKKIREDIRQKNKSKQVLPIPILSESAQIQENVQESDFSYTKKQKKEKSKFNEEFKDKVIISSKNWAKSTHKKEEIENKKIEVLTEKRKYNANIFPWFAYFPANK